MPFEFPEISTRIFEGFEAFMAKNNVHIEPLLEAAGISRQAFANREGTLPLPKVAALFENAALHANDPCLGLQWAEAFVPGSTGVMGYSVLNAANLREAMQAVARYLTLVIHPAHVSFEESAGTGVLSWHLAALTATSTTQYISFSVASTILRLRAVAGPSWQPVLVELTHRELPCTDTIRRILGARVEFNAATNAVHADAESLDLKSQHRDPRIFELMEHLGCRMLAEQTSPTNIGAQTQKFIAGRLVQGDVTLEAAAGALDMAPRTLQSKLAGEGTAFDTLLQDTRKNLAIGYLRESDLTMTDIALMLGFSELSAFSRATVRWFGMSPSALRHQLRGPAGRAG